MLVIRLVRIGTTNDKKFRVIVQEKDRAPQGRFLEILGHYNPQTQPHTFVINKERYTYWVGVGAQPSDTVKSLVNSDSSKAKKKKPKKNKKQKAREAAAREEAAKKAEEEKAAKEAEAAKAAEDAEKAKTEDAKTEPAAESAAPTSNAGKAPEGEKNPDPAATPDAEQK